jgi:DNA-binding NtrC family response regulator
MNESVRIVVIDDNPGSLELLSSALSRPGVSVKTAGLPEEGLQVIRSWHPQLVITDLVMPGMDGLAVLAEIVRLDPMIDVILMTAHYTTETAVAAIRAGAADYLQKPVKLTLLRERVAHLLEEAAQRARVRSDEGSELMVDGMVARSAVMWQLFAMIQRIAPHYRSVLLQGPTGSGKDLIAAALHRRSGVTGRFVVLNCSAVVETLFESELFGHVRGAFTGADRDKIGLLEFAHNGTLFLDEIGDMPPSTQAKLLRALQNQEVLPVGSLTPRRIQVRIIAATHKDLRAAITAGTFREDLYYRLSMVELQVPPLAARREDIALLAQHFLARYNREFNRQVQGFEQRALLVMQRHDWPGNVRELEHCIARACMLCEHALIDVGDLPASMVAPHVAVLTDAPATDDATSTTLHAQERRLVVDALEAEGGNQSAAARRLGIGRDALRYKMKRFHIADEQGRTGKIED